MQIDTSAAVSIASQRGLPEAATAYARILVLPRDTMLTLMVDACQSAADSIAELPTVVPNIWDVLRAELDAAVSRACRDVPSDKDFGCRIRKGLEGGVAIDMARKGIPSDAPASYREEALAVRAVAVRRQRELTEKMQTARLGAAVELRERARQRLADALAARDTVVRSLDRTGRFRFARPPAGAAAASLFVAPKP
jgi:hypothetical protein